MKTKTYFLLDLDNYNQPTGNIQELKLTKQEFEKIKEQRGYIYKKYIEALYRVQD